MPVQTKLDEPLYAFPIDDAQLVILGRITIMWGHVDSAIDQIVDQIHRFRPFQAEIFLPSTTVGTKVSIVKKSLSLVSDEEARLKISAALEALERLLPDRNHVTHGRWGWHVDLQTHETTPAAEWGRRRQQPFLGSELADLHNKIATAARLVDEAFYAVWRKAPAPIGVNNRRFLFGNGPPPEPDKLRGVAWQPLLDGSPVSN
jgi:hypothetical protein